ncbi:hypothetical protein HDU92_007738 [Lobulomyces angularis]|nr:hypothetical protein HDU92_007738 [Lobulomyces angularis]
MNNNEVADLIYNLLSKEDSKNLSRVNKTLHFVYNRRISNLYSVSHKLKRIFSEDLYNKLIEVMKECRSFLSGSFITDTINLKNSKSNIDIYCQCKNSPNYHFDNYGAMIRKMTNSSSALQHLTEIYNKIVHQNVDKASIADYILDIFIRFISPYEYYVNLLRDKTPYDKVKITEIVCRYTNPDTYKLLWEYSYKIQKLCLTIFSSYYIEKQCPLYQFFSNNLDIENRYGEYVEDIFERSCSKVMHKFRINNRILSLIHCNRSEIIGNDIDSLINKQDNTMNINYWIPEESEFIFCGFPSLTLENKNLFLHRFDEYDHSDCHTYNDIFAYNIKNIIPYNKFIFNISQSLYYRVIFLFADLVSIKYESEFRALGLNINPDTNISLLKNIMNNIENLDIDWSYIDNNDIHDGKTTFKISSVKYKIHSRSRNIPKIYKQIKSEDINDDKLNQYILMLSGGRIKFEDTNILMIRNYVISHILMDSIKDKDLSESVKKIKDYILYLNTSKSFRFTVNYYKLKNDIDTYNLMIKYNNDGYTVLNFPRNNDVQLNHRAENPSKMPLINNIFSKKYMPIVKYKKKGGNKKPIFFEKDIIKMYSNKYAKIKFIPSTVGL